ncbi:MAG: hypothetical protein U9O98_11170 [Asgard group archaeon]|nr:hypothetical protein [Asgard group archaeon]
MEQWKKITLSTTGPLNLVRTIETGHSAFPVPLKDKEGNYYLILTLPYSQKKYITKFRQIGERIYVWISYRVKKPTSQELSQIRKILRESLGLNMNLQDFFDAFKDDPITRCFEQRSGIRLPKAHDLFESLICSIMSQNNSIWRWNGQIRKIKELLGEKFPVEHFMIYSFPNARQIFRNKHLLSRAKLGYREEYVIAASEYIANRQLRLENLKKLSTPKAREKLIEIKGIGEKVADMFLLYGLGKGDIAPTDIWIKKAISELFFNGKTQSLERCREKLVNHYGKYAGIAQLYIYDWRRRKSQLS